MNSQSGLRILVTGHKSGDKKVVIDSIRFSFVLVLACCWCRTGETNIIGNSEVTG